MNDRTQMVAEFHAANGFPVGGTPFEVRTEDGHLQTVGEELVKFSREMLMMWTHTKRQHFMRYHLILEELGEAMLAHSKGDVIGTFDGIIDLDYVVQGTSVIYGLPHQAGFVEVHTSNMTKERQPSDVHCDRLRQKGEYYVEPDLKSVLAGRPTLLQGLALLARHEQCTVLQLLKRERVVNAKRIDGVIDRAIYTDEINGRSGPFLASATKAKLLEDRWASAHQAAYPAEER